MALDGVIDANEIRECQSYNHILVESIHHRQDGLRYEHRGEGGEAEK